MGTIIKTKGSGRIMRASPPIRSGLVGWGWTHRGTLEDRLRNLAAPMLPSARAVGTPGVVNATPDDEGSPGEHGGYLQLGNGNGIDSLLHETLNMTVLFVAKSPDGLQTSADRPVYVDGSLPGSAGDAAALYLSGATPAAGATTLRIQSKHTVSGSPQNVAGSINTTNEQIAAWALYAAVWESGVAQRIHDLTNNISNTFASANPRIVETAHTIRFGVGGTVSQTGEVHLAQWGVYNQVRTLDQLLLIRDWIAAALPLHNILAIPPE